MCRARIQVSLQALRRRPWTVMGILNVTPDSFYDGGRHHAPDAAVEHGLHMAAAGADVIDVGGESTRPGAAGVDEAQERARVVPVVEQLARRVDVPVSVDTTKAAVARAALDAGARWVNDVSAGRFDPAMAPFVAQRQCPVVLMHSRGTPATMQQDPAYADVVGEVEAELLAAAGLFASAGVARENIILDPGIGFAKRQEDNIALLQGLRRLAGLGYPLLVGTSRKSLVGHLTGRPVGERLAGSLGGVAAAFTGGAWMFRVHDVGETVDMLKVLSALQPAEGRPA